MWRHRRSKTPMSPGAELGLHQESRPRHSRLKEFFSRSHKNDDDTAQPAKPESTVEPKLPVNVTTTAIETRSEPSKISVDEVERDHRKSETNRIAEVEGPTTLATEPPMARTDADARMDHETISHVPRDLWQEAVGKLDEKHKKTLRLLDGPGYSPRSAVNAIEDVVLKTEKNLAAYNTRGETQRQVSETARKVLDGTLKVKKIIDAGVQFDPTGYASTAWGVISLGLQLAQNDMDRIDSVFGAAAFLTDILSRYANIEAHYRNQDIRDVGHLEDHIVTVYKAILEYSAKVRDNNTMAMGSRILETFYALDKPHLQELRDTVDATDTAMDRWRQLIGHEYRIKESAQVAKKLDGALEQLKELTVAENEREFTEIKNWVSTASTSANHNPIANKINPNTAEWIFQNEKYLSWLQEPQVSNRILWLYGPYGSGKSVLFANVMNHLNDQKGSRRIRVCAYWYFDGHSDNNTIAGLRSIISQLLGSLRIVPEALKKLKEDHKRANREPSQDQLITVLSALINETRSQSEIIIAFDGLDECPDRADILKAIAALNDKAYGVKIFLASRPEEDIKEKIKPVATGILPILDEVQDDVERFVKKELESKRFAKYDEDIRDAIRTKLLVLNDRRFRLAELRLQVLRKCANKDDIYKALNNLPGTIYHAYEKELAKFSEEPGRTPKIKALLAWMSVAKRNLTIEELGSVLGLDYPENLLEDCPTCLIRITEDEWPGETLFEYPEKVRIVAFDHSSVREFLASARIRTEENESLSQYFIDAEQWNIKAAVYCLDIILAQNEPGSLEVAVKKEPMLLYAATYWIDHANRKISDSTKESQFLDHPQIINKVERLFSDGHASSFLNWLRVHDPDEPNRGPDLLRPREECAQPLYYAALLGLEDIIESFLEHWSQVEFGKGSFNDAIIAAASHGRIGCLERMLKKGYNWQLWAIYQSIEHAMANPSEVLDVILNASPISNDVLAKEGMLATDRIVEAAMKNLESAKDLIDTVSRRNLAIRCTVEVAEAAAQNDRTGEDALKLLLRRQQDHWPITEKTLEVIAENFSWKTMKLALDRAGNTPITERLGVAAIKNRCYSEEVFELLLDYRGDQLQITETMVKTAVKNEYLSRKLLNTLISRGGKDMPITKEFVLAVAKKCDAKQMELLANRIQEAPGNLELALAAATNEEHGPEVLRMVLERDEEGSEITPDLIEEAVKNHGHRVEMISFLINKIRPEGLEITGRTIFLLSWGMETALPVLKMLLQKGSRTMFSNDAVRRVMTEFDTDVVELLLDHHRAASIPIPDEAVEAAAACANEKHGKDVLSLLVRALGNHFPVTEEIVVAAVKHLDLEVVKLLLEHRGDAISITSAVLSSIAENKHSGPEILDIFLKYKAQDIYVDDCMIQAAASSPNSAKAMTSRLLSHKGDKFDITEKAVLAVARTLDSEILSLVLSRWTGDEQSAQTTILEAAAQNHQYGADLVKFLFNHYDHGIPLTRGIINAASGNSGCGSAILSLFLDRDDSLPLGEDTIEIVAGNVGNGSQTLDLLFQNGYNVQVTSAALKAGASNPKQGLEIITKLLSQRRNDISITPQILACAAGNEYRGAEIVKLLLNQPGGDSSLTEEVICAAVSNGEEKVLAALFTQQHWDYIPLSTNVMCSAYSPLKLAALLRSLPRDLVIGEFLVKAVIKTDFDAEMTSLLLDYRGKDIRITRRIVEAVLDKPLDNGDIIRLILRRRGADFPVTDEIVIRMAEQYDRDTISLLMDQRGADVMITDAVLQAAARNSSHGPHVLRFLLTWQQDIQITEELVIASAENLYNAPELIGVLLEICGDKVPVTDKVLYAARWKEETLSLLADKRGQDIPLTSEVVYSSSWHRTPRGRKLLDAVLHRLGPQSQVTEDAAEALAIHFGAEELAALFDRCGDAVPITSRIIGIASGHAGCERHIVKMLLNRPAFYLVSNKQILVELLKRFDAAVVALLWAQSKTDIILSEEIVMEVAKRTSDNVMQLLLSRPPEDVPLSPRIIETIARRFNSETISILLARQVDITITEHLINAVVQYNRDRGQVLSVLLAQQSSKVQISEEVLLEITQKCDGNIMQLLYTHLGDDFLVTSSIFHAAGANESHRDEVVKVLANHMPVDLPLLTELAESCEGDVMGILLQHLGPNVRITDDLITATTKNGWYGSKVMLALLEHQADHIPLTETTLITMFGRFNGTVIKTLLDKRNKDVILTQEVVLAIDENYHSDDVMEVLINRRLEDIPLTEKSLMYLEHSLSGSIISVLLERIVDLQIISEDILSLAVDNYDFNHELLPVLMNKWEKNMPINAAIVMNIARKCNQVIMRLLLEKRKTDVAISEELVDAISRNSEQAKEVMTVLLTHGEKASPNENTLAAIARDFDREVLDLFLDQHAGSVPVTENTLEAAASNYHHGDKIMERLLEISEIPISRKVVHITVGNDYSGACVMNELLWARGQDVPITPYVIQKAIAQTDGELLHVILHYREREIPITATLVEMCAKSAIETLLSNREHYSLVTAQAVAAIAERFDVGIMKALLDVHEQDVPMTEDVVAAAAMNEQNGAEVLALLLDRQGANIPVTEQLLESIIRTPRYDEDIMRVLLERRKEIRLTEEMVRLAAANEKNGSKLMTLFFHQRRTHLRITEKVVKAAAGNDIHGVEIMAFLLEKFGDDLPITEKVVLAAVRNMEYKKLIKLLQDYREIPVTARVLEMAAARYSDAMVLLPMLLSQDGSERLITEAVIAAALHSLEAESVLPILIRHGQSRGQVIVTKRTLEEATQDSYRATNALIPFLPDDLQISEAIMENIVARDLDEAPLTRTLLERRGKEIPITAAIVRVAQKYRNRREIIKLLFQHHRGTLHVTEDLLIETARGFDGELMAVLLDSQDVPALVTEAVVQAALENRDHGAEVLEALFKLQIKLPVTEKTILDATRNTEIREDVLDILLRIVPPEMSITESVVKAVVSNKKMGKPLLKVLLKYSSMDIPITDDIATAVVMNDGCGKELLDVLFDMSLKEDTLIDQQLLTATAGNTSGDSNLTERSTERKGVASIRPFLNPDLLLAAVNNFCWGTEIMAFLLKQRMDIPITTEVLKATVGRPYCSTEMLQLLLEYPGFDAAAITPEVLKTAVSNDNAQSGTINLLLERTVMPTPITEEIMNAAASNSSVGEEIMSLLLARQSTSALVTQEVSKAAAEDTSNGKDEIELNSQCGSRDMITTKVVDAAAIDLSIQDLVLILDEMGDDVQISEDAMKRLVSSKYNMDKLRLLLEWLKNDVSISEAVVTEALTGPAGAEMLAFFLRRWGKNVPITQDVVSAVVADWTHAHTILPLLFRQVGRDVPVTEQVVIAAAQSTFSLELLLDERGEDLPITENVLKAVVQQWIGRLETLRLLFSQQGENIPFSEEVLEAASQLNEAAISFFLKDHWQVPS